METLVFDYILNTAIRTEFIIEHLFCHK